jgi:hypothetical protein
LKVLREEIETQLCNNLSICRSQVRSQHKNDLEEELSGAKWGDFVVELLE